MDVFIGRKKVASCWKKAACKTTLIKRQHIIIIINERSANQYCLSILSKGRSIPFHLAIGNDPFSEQAP